MAAHLLCVCEGVGTLDDHLGAKDLGGAREERDGDTCSIICLKTELVPGQQLDRAPRLGGGGSVASCGQHDWAPCS